MNQKGYFVLKSLIDKQLVNKIGFVVSSSDKGVAEDFYFPIKKLCIDNLIPFAERKHDAPFTDFKIAIGWRWLIDHNENLIVLHDSLLPKYRGFAPLVIALINGEKEIGATELWAENDFDQGDII